MKARHLWIIAGYAVMILAVLVNDIGWAALGVAFFAKHDVAELKETRP